MVRWWRATNGDCHVWLVSYDDDDDDVEDDGDGDVDDRVDDNGGNINGLHNGRLPDAGARRREGAPGSKCQHICHFLYSYILLIFPF